MRNTAVSYARNNISTLERSRVGEGWPYMKSQKTRKESTDQERLCIPSTG
jgi:hypothetical protein